MPDGIFKREENPMQTLSKVRFAMVRPLCVLLIGLVALSAPLRADWIQAGPIWNDYDANRKCPVVCGSGRWDGNWKTIQTGRMSVCSCPGSRSKPIQVLPPY